MGTSLPSLRVITVTVTSDGSGTDGDAAEAMETIDARIAWMRDDLAVARNSLSRMQSLSKGLESLRSQRESCAGECSSLERPESSARARLDAARIRLASLSSELAAVSDGLEFGSEQEAFDATRANSERISAAERESSEVSEALADANARRS